MAASSDFNLRDWVWLNDSEPRSLIIELRHLLFSHRMPISSLSTKTVVPGTQTTAPTPNDYSDCSLTLQMQLSLANYHARMPLI